MVEFTDEEGYGKYLDLHQCYEKFINLKGMEKIDYITYLTTFDQLYEISREKKTPEYVRYMEKSFVKYLTQVTVNLRSNDLLHLGTFKLC